MSFIRKIRKKGKIYLAEVENSWVNGKCVQRHIRYVGRQADNKTILSASISDAVIDKVKLHGPLLVLNHLAKEIGLSEILGHFGDEILSMVFAHCLDYKSINHMEQWFERTDLNMILDLDGLTEGRLLEALDSLEKLDVDALQKQIFGTVRKRYKLLTTGVIYDVTNTYLYGKKCPFAKRGKDKEGVKGRPLIQIGLGVTQVEGIPVFHKIYDGNTGDSRTFQDAITMFEDYGIKDGMFVFDRGISSERIQNDIALLEWSVVCGLRLTESLKKIVRPLIKKQKAALDTLGNRVRLNETVFYVTTAPYSIGKIKGTLAICFNEQQRRDLKESRYDELMNAQALLKCGKNIKPGLEIFFKREKLNMEAVNTEEEFDGYSFVFTTADLSKEKLIHIYFDKDLVEKAFHCLKGIVRLRPIRHWLYNRVTAHIFICYLSYLLLSLLKLRLMKLKMSPVKALKELDSLYKVYLRDSRKGFEVAKMVALNRNQEKILRAIDKKLIPSV